MTWYDPDREDKTIYKVVVNDEEQYSIWPEYKKNPPGWRDCGKSGPKAECLEYIKSVWTDMRPLSLRKKMEEMAKTPPPPPPPHDPDRAREKSLVDRLCEGSHLVEVGLHSEKTARRFKEAIERNYVPIRFTKTRGGTDLRIRLDHDLCDFSKADFESGTGTVHLEGGLTLDYVALKCVVELDLHTLEGTGRLVKTGLQAEN